MTTKRKTPMRTCIVSRQSLPKNELIRVVRTPEGAVVIDKTGKLNGRGAYISRTLSILEKARKSKALERHLQVTIPTQIYDELLDVITSETNI